MTEGEKPSGGCNALQHWCEKATAMLLAAVDAHRGKSRLHPAPARVIGRERLVQLMALVPAAIFQNKKGRQTV